MLIAAVGQYFFGITIFVSSLFLIMLVLVQRGRGGGLAGALGGPGGQSAFGTKAGDLFTRITIVVATIWIFLCASAVYFLKTKKFTTPVSRSAVSGTDTGAVVPAVTGGTLDGAGDGLSGAPLPADVSTPAGNSGTTPIVDPAVPADTTPEDSTELSLDPEPQAETGQPATDSPPVDR